MGQGEPREPLRRELDDQIAGLEGEADPVEAIGRLGDRLILQQVLEVSRGTDFSRRARIRADIVCNALSDQAARASLGQRLEWRAPVQGGSSPRGR